MSFMDSLNHWKWPALITQSKISKEVKHVLYEMKLKNDQMQLNFKYLLN